MAAVGEDENEEEDVVEGRQAGRRTATSSVQSACEGPTHFKLRNVALLFALSGTADATRSLQSMSTRPQPTPALPRLLNMYLAHTPSTRSTERSLVRDHDRMTNS